MILWRFSRPTLIATIELHERLPVLALVAVLIWYLAAPSAAAAVCLAALAALLVSAFLWARAMARHVTGRRSLKYAAVQVGDEIQEVVTLQNDSPLPVLWAEFLDRSNLPGHTVAGVCTADPHASFTWSPRSTCSRRGVFALGPWELRLSDPFGIFIVRQTYVERQEILVHPSLAALPQRLLPHGGVLGDHRPHRQPLPADTTMAISTRPYVPGDPLRRVHWPSTARHGSLFTKLFEPEGASNIWLIPDCDSAVHLGAGQDSTEETMVTLVATLAAQLLQRQLAVGLLIDDGSLRVIPPRRGTSHLWALLRALSPLHACPGRPLAGTLAQANSLVGTRHLVVVVTPSASADWVRALRRLAGVAHGGGAEAILLDPVSFGGSGNVEPCVSLLQQLGINHQVVPRGAIQPIVGSYGALSRWEFKTLSTGRVWARQTPRHSPSLAAQLDALGAGRESHSR